MSKTKRNNSIAKRATYIINIDREKISKTVDENKKNINIIEDCKKFCEKYGNTDFKRYNVYNLKNICNEGSGLLDTYFITKENNKEHENFIIQLEYIIMSANYALVSKQMENTRQNTIEFNEKLNRTMRNAEKIEKDASERTKEIKHIKSDIKSIVTTILAIVLAFSIIPTAITGITKIEANYIIPFMASIILFGMIMVIFIYSIYQDKLKTSTWLIIIVTIIICIISWCGAIYKFNDISKDDVKDQKNNIQEIEEEN